jgi:uncharacterized protein YggU (UPF0235/DUF167 family)
MRRVPAPEALRLPVAPPVAVAGPVAVIQWSMASGDVTILAIRVKPGARRPRVGGRHEGPHGPALVVAVTAPAVDGRATEAALRAVASALGLRRSDVSLRAGASSRDKLIGISASPAAWVARLGELRDPAGPGDGTR